MRSRLLLPLILAAAGCASLQPPKEPPPLSGRWGGQHIGLVLDAEAGIVSYDCAAGRMDGPVIPNTIGEFHVRGTHTPGTGGPARAGEVPRSYPALYHGSVRGAVLTLRVIVPSTGQVIGPAELIRDQEPVITRCL